MKKMSNGWALPDDDQRVTFLVENDTDMFNPAYEEKYRNVIIEHLPNKRTFVDVGANVGLWSLPMTKYFQKIISYEPSKQNIECIKINIPKGIELREKAVADFQGEAEFHQAGKNCGDGKLVRDGKHVSYKVPVVKLDEEQLSEVDFVKIDTQGWELEVLRGMKNLILDQNPWVMFEINQDVDYCCKFMEQFDYEVIFVKSKRNFIWAPRKGHNSPVDRNILKRYLGPGPYVERFGGKKGFKRENP